MDFGRYQRTSNQPIGGKIEGRISHWSVPSVDGTFQFEPRLFFSTVFFYRTCPRSHSAAVYCLVRNKTRVVYIPDAIKAVIPTATPECILLDFESAAVSAFRTAFTTAMLALLGVIST